MDKACPFCPNESRSIHPVNLPRQGVAVRCMDCGCTGPACETEPKAREAWNRRAPEVRPEAAPSPGPHECGWTETAKQYAGGMELYRSLLDECAKHLGPAAYTADDGRVHEDPIRLNIPGLVAKLAAAPALQAPGAPADDLRKRLIQRIEENSALLAQVQEMEDRLRKVFYFRLPGIGERVDDVICREDNALYWAVSAALGGPEGVGEEGPHPSEPQGQDKGEG